MGNKIYFAKCYLCGSKHELYRGGKVRCSNKYCTFYKLSTTSTGWAGVCGYVETLKADSEKIKSMLVAEHMPDLYETSDDMVSEFAIKIATLTQQLKEREGQLVEMRCCGNCANSDRTGARQICVGCHGYKDVSPKEKETYLINWQPATARKIKEEIGK